MVHPVIIAKRLVLGGAVAVSALALAPLAWAGAPPANDNFANAELLQGAFGRVTGTTVDSSREDGEPDHATAGGSASVWYRWTPTTGGLVKFDTLGSNFDTLLAVYTGDALGNLTLVGANDDSSLFGCCTSRVSFTATAGTAYRIAVDGFHGDTGAFTLNWSPVVQGTSGDDILTGTPGPEEIVGGPGNDSISADGGDDLIFAGTGRDSVAAGSGNDVATGQAGNDVLAGGAGNDLLRDFRGADALLGRSGNDELGAEDGRANDALRGGTGVDECSADRGDSRRSCA